MEGKRDIKSIQIQLIQNIKNYIFPINIEGKYGTCFFFKTKKEKYLCVSYDLISPEFIKSQGSIKINNDLSIRLNQQRTILSFGTQCKLILITEKENVDKYILEIDLPQQNYKNKDAVIDLPQQNYKNKDAVMLAYSFPFKENEENCGGFIPGKILKIEEYKILHQFNTKNLLFVSPICVINGDKFNIVGVQLENPKDKEYKYMSYGYLLTYILNSLNIEYSDGENNIANNYILTEEEIERNNFLTEYGRNANYSFYTFEEYKNAIYYLHFRISRFYNNQTFQNYNNKYHFVNKNIYKKYLNNLRNFKNINNNQFQIFNNIEIAKNFNEILLSNNLEKIKDFSYFIAGFMYVLNSYSAQKDCQFSQDGHLLYTRLKLSKIDLEKLNENLDKLITFKTFLIDIMTLEHLHGIINAKIFDFNNFFSFKSSDKFDTKIYIKHKYKIGWKASCFSFTSSVKIFNLFTFFKVTEVKIDYELKYAEVKLELIGKNEIFENKIGNKDLKFKIDYNKNDEIIQIF